VKVLHVTPRIDAAMGGPAYSIPALAQALARQGAEVELHVLRADSASGNGYRVHIHPNWPLVAKLGISPSLRRTLHEQAAQADILHSHGLWTLPNIYPAAAIRGQKCRLVVSPRGMLTAWALARSRWRKKVMWLLGQKNALRAAHGFHATAESEYHDIRTAGLKSPVAIIPNGVDIPPETDLHRTTTNPRQLLFLGRLAPFKRVDVLLQAWRQVQERFADWCLEIVGPDEGGYGTYIKQLGDELGVQRVAFRGPAYGPAKTQALAQAQLLVLPSYSENFGLAAAEALAHGVPVIVTQGAPWSGVRTHRCGWWIEGGVAPLVACLEQALTLPPAELAEMGTRGREWMTREFSWEPVARMMLTTYRWLHEDGTPPDWVRTD